MSFGRRMVETFRALDADGLPANLRATELERRAAAKMVELGYDPRTELPSRRTLLRPI